MYPTPPFTDPHKVAAEADKAVPLNEGLLCGGCQYSLRTIALEQACPECGRSVLLSFREKKGDLFNDIWLKTARLAIIALVISTAMAFLMDLSTLVNTFGLFDLEGVKPYVRKVHLFWFAVIVTMIVTTGFAFWTLSWPDATRRYPGLSVHGRWLFLAFLISVPITFSWQMYISQGQSKVWDKISTTSKLIIITSDLAMSAVWLCLIFLAARVAQTCMQEKLKVRIQFLLVASILIPLMLAVFYQVVARIVTPDMLTRMEMHAKQVGNWMNLAIYAGLIVTYLGLVRSIKQIEARQASGE